MKKEYRAMYDKIAPLKSDEELLGSILSRKGNITMKNEKQSKKHISKAIAIPIAAALALGATAVGAVAVYNRNVNEEYARVLERPDYEGRFKWQNLTDKDGNEVDENVKAANDEMFERLNIELDQTFECDGFTIDFPGAVCDGETMLLFYNVTFDEEMDIYEKDHFSLREDFDAPEFGIGKIFKGGRGINGKLEKIDGKYFFSGCDDFYNIDTFTEDVLSIHFTNLDGHVGNYVHPIQNFDIDITLDIPLADDMDKYNKTVEVPSAPHVDIAQYGDWDIRSITVTPLNLFVDMTTDHETPDPEVIYTYWVQFPAAITFKDGSVLDLAKQIGGMDMDDENRTFMVKKWLEFPIDVDNIETIQIADAVIDTDGNVTRVEIPEPHAIGDGSFIVW